MRLTPAIRRVRKNYNFKSRNFSCKRNEPGVFGGIFSALAITMGVCIILEDIVIPSYNFFHKVLTDKREKN